MSEKTLDPRVEDTYAEAFPMKFARLIITAIDRDWLQIAAGEFCGYGTSVIGCDMETAIEHAVPETGTPDERPGVAVLAFGFSKKELIKAVINRAGQCLMTCPTTAIFNGWSPPEPQSEEDLIPVGKMLRYFGDGFQKSKLLGNRRYWRVPVMDGEFICEEHFGIGKGIAGGNFIIQSTNQAAGLNAATRAVQAIKAVSGCITPFPGGIARSGSKVGSRYKNQIASTAESFCPTLKGRVDSRLHPDAVCAYEIVIDAIDEPAMRRSMSIGIRAALNHEYSDRILRISAGNYGGKLGKHLIHLSSLDLTG